MAIILIKQGSLQLFTGLYCTYGSLAWPDPFSVGTYRLEIISAPLKGSGALPLHTNIYHNSV